MTTADARTQLDPLGVPRTVRMVRRFEAPPSRLKGTPGTDTGRIRRRSLARILPDNARGGPSAGPVPETGSLQGARLVAARHCCRASPRRRRGDRAPPRELALWRQWPQRWAATAAT